MPSATSTVGALELPYPVGEAPARITDPLVKGMLDYLAYWIRADLNPALVANQAGKINGSGLVTDAVPAANRYPWDPGPTFVRGAQDGAAAPLPGLFVWRAGRRRVRESILESLREVRLGFVWVFEELVMPGALVDRYGLRAVVEASIDRAMEHGYHPSYGYDGAPVGTPIAKSLCLAGALPFLESSEETILGAVPMTGLQSQNRGAGGPSIRGFPALRGVIIVHEKIGAPTLVDPDDARPDMTVNIQTNSLDDGSAPLTVMERVLPCGPGPEDT